MTIKNPLFSFRRFLSTVSFMVIVALLSACRHSSFVTILVFTAAGKKLLLNVCMQKDTGACFSWHK